MTTTAVLVASFSLREGNEPNPCNRRLALEALRIYWELVEEGRKPILIVQWEVGLALRLLGQGRLIYKEIGQLEDGAYLGTKEIFDVAVGLFEDRGATEFVGIANAFIHQPYLYWLARRHFRLVWKRVRGIGFDSDSDQWWCRSWWQLLAYTGYGFVTGAHGHDGRQAKA